MLLANRCVASYGTPLLYFNTAQSVPRWRLALHPNIKLGNKKIRYLLLANYLNLFAFSFYLPLFALFVIGLGGDAKIIGLSAGATAYTTAIMILIFGRWENSRKHKEKMIVVGYFWLAFGALGFMLVDHIWQLFAVQIFNAIGVGLITPALRTTYASLEDRGQETQEWSFWDGGNALFAATGAVLGGFLLSALGGFRGLFALIATIQFVAALISLKILKK